MKTELLKLLALMMTTMLLACGGDTGTSPGPGDGEEAADGASTTVTTRATLEAAVPANGAVVAGDFFLGALVDSPELVEVRFLIDGVEVGVVNEHPYQLPISACDLTEGNHSYIVTIEDAAGGSDYVEQFFESAPCS